MFDPHKTMNQLEQLMGYVANGSDTPVKLSQDDATGSYIVTIGTKVPGKHFTGATLEEAINEAFIEEVAGHVF